MPSKPRNRIGESYGKLTVVRPSERRTKSGNAYWWCRCSCGREREVAGDKLSTNINRRKPVVTACLVCSRELQVEGVCAKNDREERKRRAEAERQRMALKGKVPDSWLRLRGNRARCCFSEASIACMGILLLIASMVVAWPAPGRDPPLIKADRSQARNQAEGDDSGLSADPHLLREQA